jgi:hypothetical protein
MRAEEFQELVRTRPFTPLRIHLTDGKTFDVFHPEQVLVLRLRIDIGMGADPKSGVLDRVEHCSLFHVVRIDELDSSPQSN